MWPSARLLAWIFGGLLAVAVTFPRIQLVEMIISVPLWISMCCVLISGALIASAVRQDSKDGISSQRYRQTRSIRSLAFTTSSAWSAVLVRHGWEEQSSAAKLPSLHPDSNHRLNTRFNGILNLIKKSFILPWYERISPSPAFPNAVEVLLRKTVIDVASRSAAVDWSTVMVNKIVPLITDHLHHFRTVEHLASSSGATSAALPLPLPQRSHPALSQQYQLSGGISSPLVENYLRELLERLLKETIPEQDRSDAVMIMVREIALGAVFLPLFDMLCDSDFWNTQIDVRGGRYLQEQKQVNRFLSALSALPAPALSQDTPRKAQTAPTSRVMPPASSISAASSSRQFDAFIKSITKLKTLGEARRLRADVEREQRAAKVTLETEEASHSRGQERDLQLKRAHKHVARLAKARIEIDKRIAILSGQSMSHSKTSLDIPTKVVDPQEGPDVRLYTILTDPSSLAYWLEFMDRRGRSQLVQFWLTVEGFKDPLEAAGPDTALDSTLETSDDSALLIMSANLRDDVKFLHDTYFAASPTTIDISQKHLVTIRDFAQSPADQLSPSGVRQIKHAVFAGQKEVYDQMQEDDWPDFQLTQLYLKVLTDVSRSKQTPAEMPSPQLQGEINSKLSGTSDAPSGFNVRRMTSPPPSRPPQEVRSPSMRSVPYLVNGSFTPGSAMPSAAISTVPPRFDRAVTDYFPPMPRESRKVSEDNLDKMAKSTSSLPVTPPSGAKRSNELDFLISDGTSAKLDDREKLFDDVDEEPVEEDNEDDDFVQIQRMEAIQAALNDIIASDDLAASRTISRTKDSPDHELLASPMGSMVSIRPMPDQDIQARFLSRSVEDLQGTQTGKSISAPHSRIPSVKVETKRPETDLTRRISMPRLSESGGKAQGLFGDEIPFRNAEESDQEAEDGMADRIQLAAPGDLQLSVEIARLQDKVQELVKQDALLETLIRQAELTGNEKELHILRKSQVSIRREQRTAIFQKAQFEQQEEENRLVPGRTQVHIPSAVVTAEEHDGGKHVVRYTIEVKQGGSEGQPSAGWVVARRYNEFWELDKSLREWAAAKGDRSLLEHLKWRVADLPAKKLVPNLSASFVETRRIGLERYLQTLINSPVLCDSQLLRSFLSRSPVPITGSSTASGALGSSHVADSTPQNIVKSLYKTVATSLDDALLGPSMLDLMSSTLSRQLTDVAEGVGGMVGLKPEELAGLGNAMLPQALKGSAWRKNGTQSSEPTPPTAFPNTLQPIGGETGTGSFAAPICDLFIEVFDLKENNWLRRQAIVVILQQFLGSTVERKVRDTLRAAMSTESIERHLSSLQDGLWPDGERRPPSTARTDAEKLETKLNASKKLSLLIPDVAANMIGRGNARRAARRVFGALQDRRLTQQLVLCILDEIFSAVFPTSPAVPP
ncbi:PXA domain-domain-containing protein [Naematelia encephala]|uniref:PXA domain-domain-containing protein n=1 Tax=Naematelia encephala TaxID=71784 RepID=A0A1Y2BFW9_9TREE|nr:PXA domain-domain-containing protein [Naematelia encephala]